MKPLIKLLIVCFICSCNQKINVEEKKPACSNKNNNRKISVFITSSPFIDHVEFNGKIMKSGPDPVLDLYFDTEFTKNDKLSIFIRNKEVSLDKIDTTYKALIINVINPRLIELDYRCKSPLFD